MINTDQKRFQYGNNISYGLNGSLEHLMEHEKNYDHHEKTLELVLQ